MIEECDKYEVYEELGEHDFGVLVEMVKGSHGSVHSEIPEGVHGTDVVQHVRIVHHHTRHAHQEVETEKNLQHPSQ